MVKVIVQEQCPACKNKFESMIEFEHQNKNNTNINNQNVKNFEELFKSNFTLGKFMQIVSLVEDASGKMGDKSVNLIIEQCRLMGLKKEDEKTIYRIIEMMGKHDVPIRDVLVTIYRFAKVMGINDDVADMYYYKLMINHVPSNKQDSFEAESIKELMWEGN